MSGSFHQDDQAPLSPPMTQGFAPPPAAGPDGLAIASLICGILSIMLFCLWFLAIPLGVIALVLGMISKGRGPLRTAGIVCSA